MSAANSTNLPQVQQVLQRCRRQILLHNTVTGLATLLTIGLACLLLATISDLLLGLPGGVRAVTLLLFVTTVALVVWKFLVRPLNTRLPIDELGAAVDLSCPEMQESLSTLISVERDDVTRSEAGSDLMRDRLSRQVHDRLAQVADTTFVDTQRLKKQCALAGLAILAVVTPLLAWPSGSRLLLQRFAQPFANLSTVSNLYFDVENGDRVVARGSDVVIRATPQWRSQTPGTRPEQVWLQLTAVDGATDQLAMTYDEVSGQFTATLPQIEQSVKFTISGGGVESQSFQLTVVDAPELTSAVLTVTPPPYAGLPVESFAGMVEEMDVFEGSRMQIELQFNKPVTAATLIWTRRDQRPLDDVQLFDREFDHITGEEMIELNPDAPLAPKLPELVMRSEVVLSEDRTAGVLQLTADVGGDFHFELTDDVQLTNPNPLDRTLSVTYDAPPQLRVSGAENLERYRSDDIVPINAVATDDIGVGELELHYYVNDEAAVIVPADNWNPGSRKATQTFRLRMEDLNVTDGDVVHVRVRCADERPMPGPHEVWSDEINVEIDRNAPPPAARAMERETQKMIEGLRELERELEGDQVRTSELEQDARDRWTDDGREQTQRLSEKQQQQGRVMEMIAEQVATHPLMQESAGRLQELVPQLSQEIPQRLETAAEQPQNLAADSLRRAQDQLSDVRADLGEVIDDLEERARLEKDLAELNRLALEAADIAERADDLKSDREQDARPDDTSEQDWEQQLNQRADQLEQDRTELTDDIESLLDREQELLKAAQQAQMSRLRDIQNTAGEIAAEQQRVADAAATEAEQASRELFRAAEELKQLEQQAANLENAQGDEESGVSEQIRRAADELAQGNLESPQEALEQAQSALGEMRNESAKATALSEQIEAVQQKLEQAGAERTFDEQAATDNSPQQQAQNSARQVLDRLDQLAEMAQAQSQQIGQEPGDAQQSSQQTSDQTAAARDSASASQFEQSARQLRDAGSSATETATQLRTSESANAAELTAEVENLRNELSRTADMLDSLQQQPQTRASARQNAQERVARQTSELPQQLDELSERMQLEALQMSPQAQQEASSAAEQAQQASEQTQQAAAEMQNAQFRQASESGQQAAEQLQQIAGTPGPSSQSSSESSMVPEDVGESVADALQNLQQAAEAMQQQGAGQQEGGGDQNAEQGGQGSQPGEPGQGEQGAGQGQSQPGEGGEQNGQNGQPGQTGQPGQSGQGQTPASDSLNSAAEALAQAASNALPGQFNPNQSPEQQQAGSDGMGNPASWDGLLPDRSGKDVAGSRDWGRIVDEIDSETLDNARISRDSTYQSLIRMYFRELARSAEK